MVCISAPTALLGSSLIGGVGSAISGGIGASAAQSAAQTQAAAANHAADLQYQMYGQTAARLQPFTDAGTGAASALAGLTGTNAGGNPLTAALTKPFADTQAQLAATPGYQFTLNQGLQATQNSYAAQGLGSSGAAMKGAAGYATGLASTTYQQQFQNYLSQNQQTYNMLAGQSSLGENAAAMTGNAGTNAVNGATSALLSGAAASAAGTVGSANAISSGVTGLLGSAGQSAALYGLLGNNGALNSQAGLSNADYKQDQLQDAGG